MKERTKFGFEVLLSLAAIAVLGIIGWKMKTNETEQIREHLGEAQPFQKKMKRSEVRSYEDVIFDTNERLAQNKKQYSRAFLLLRRANAKAHLGRYESALEDCALAKEDKENFAKGFQAGELASVMAQHEEYAKATDLWEKLLIEYPESKNFLYSYGCFLSDTKNDDLRDPQRAVGLIEMSLEPGKIHSMEKRQLAVALSRAKNFDKAVLEMCEAVSLFERESEERQIGREARIGLFQRQEDLRKKKLEEDGKEFVPADYVEKERKFLVSDRERDEKTLAQMRGWVERFMNKEEPKLSTIY